MKEVLALTSARQIRDAAAAALRKSSPARIASPYWSTGTLDALGFGNGLLKSRLDVLCDLHSGACDVSAIREMLERGARVVSVKGLHAKVYLGRGGVVVGSANATASGLWYGAYAKAGNYEAAFWDQRRDAAGPWLVWWKEMEKRGIDLADRRVADLLLDIAAQNQAEKPVSLLTALQARSYKPGSTPLHVAIDWTHVSKKVIEEAARLSKELHKTISAWQSWPEMPKASNIISFMLEANGSVISDGVWRSPSNPKASQDPHTKAIFVSQVDLIDRRYRLGAVSKWQTAVRACVAKYPNRFKGGGRGICLPIEQFTEFVAKTR